MLNSLKKTAADDKFFLIGFGLYIALQVFRFSFFITEYDMEYYYINGISICSVFWALHVIFKHLLNNYKSILWFASMILAAGIVGYMGDGAFYNNYLVHAFILVFMAKDVPFDKMARIAAIMTSAVLLVVIICSQTGIITDYIFTFGGDRVRHGLGFFYVLYAPNFFSNVTALYVYLRRKKIHPWEWIILIIPNVYLYIMTDSRLAFYSSLLFILISAVLKYAPDRLFAGKIRHYLVVAITPLFFVLSIIATFIYDGNIGWMSTLNSKLEGRLSLMQSGVETHGIGLTGRNIDMHGYSSIVFGYTDPSEYNYIDNLYVQFLVTQGIIITLLILVGYTISIYKAWKLSDYYAELIFIVIAAHAILDDLVYKVHYNTFVILSFAMLCGFIQDLWKKHRKHRNQFDT